MTDQPASIKCQPKQSLRHCFMVVLQVWKTGGAFIYFAFGGQSASAG
jgi:hypothetical protein